MRFRNSNFSQKIDIWKHTSVKTTLGNNPKTYNPINNVLVGSKHILKERKTWDYFLKKLITKSALSGVSKLTFLETVRAVSSENPHEFMRYETLNEC
ncbi:hypothetical protein CFP56_044001 [Quercus suber]|uniref:Uncharacterized protein n=1 Tax=Quercus suber TaxID=58331 RepID=A0AAW0LG16_QUESU